MDLIPLPNAVFHGCSYESSPPASTALENLRGLGCTASHTEIHAELLYERHENFYQGALPCPLDQYRLHKCGK